MHMKQVGIVLLVLLTACSAVTTGHRPAPAEPEPSRPCTVSEWTWRYDPQPESEAYYLCGVMEENARRPFLPRFVNVRLYGPQGELIGVNSSSIGNGGFFYATFASNSGGQPTIRYTCSY
jgi:hypothetical protein